MPNHVPPSWRPLPASAPGLPNLLVSVHVTDAAYTIQLTDLASLWRESLDKKAICLRALQEDASIDPTDGPDQIRRLLELLRAALDPCAPEYGDSSLALARDGDDELILRLTVVLPEPLRTLKWPVRMKRKAPRAVAGGLVIPMVRANAAQRREMEGLMDALEEKDKVIGRLVDALDGAGVPLDSVFTGLASKRGVTREMAEKRVAGLATFDLGKFREAFEIQAGQTEKEGVQGLLEWVFGRDGLAGSLDAEGSLDDTLGTDGWWTSLGKGKGTALVEQKREANPAAKETKHDANEEDKDFQVQVKPHRNKPAPQCDTVGVHDTSTDSEADAPPSPSPANQPNKTTSGPSQAKTRIGAIGQDQKRPCLSLPADVTIPPLSEKGSPAAAEDGEIDSETDDEAENAAVRSTAPERGVLGRARSQVKTASPAPSKKKTAPPSQPASRSAPSSFRRLEAIGKPSRGNGPAASQRLGHIGTASRIDDKRSQASESADERADRRRAQLKCEQQRKGVQSPAKKKRRF